MMPHLFRFWPDVARRISSAPAIALFLDFDGTLAPFVAEPSSARLPSPSRRALRRLACLPRTRIWIISARRRDDLLSRIAVPRLQYLGLYGWENGGLPQFDEGHSRMLAEARRQIADRIRRISGVRIEDKDATFALHWRGAPPDSFQQAARALHSVMAQFDGNLRVMHGDRVWEVTPAELRDKGVAARLHWRAWCGCALPIYLGDSHSDEFAFAALASGITVCVGRTRSTRAHFHVRDTREVGVFLEKLEKEIRPL